MGLMDLFTTDATAEVKITDLYNMFRESAHNEAQAKHLLNAVNCEVPYKYIRETMTGEKEEAADDGIKINIPREILDTVIEEARAAAQEALKNSDFGEAGADFTATVTIEAENGDAAAGEKEPLFDCAGENVKCAECPNKDACDEFLSNEESEGGEE